MKTQKNKKNDNQNFERNIQKVISVKTSLVSLAIGAILMIATATLTANAAYALSPVYSPWSYPTDPYSGADLQQEMVTIQEIQQHLQQKVHQKCCRCRSMHKVIRRSANSFIRGNL
jgi:hypothetical protein